MNVSILASHFKYHLICRADATRMPPNVHTKFTPPLILISKYDPLYKRRPFPAISPAFAMESLSQSMLVPFLVLIVVLHSIYRRWTRISISDIPGPEPESFLLGRAICQSIRTFSLNALEQETSQNSSRARQARYAPSLQSRAIIEVLLGRV